MQKLNATGKKQLRTLIILTFLGLGVIVGLAWLKVLHFILYILAGLVPILYYAWIYHKLHTKLQGQVLAAAGFWEQTKDEAEFQRYSIAKRGKLHLSPSYSGQFREHTLEIIQFSLTIGGGKTKQTYNFMGAEFVTPSEHLPVQVYDDSHPLKPWFGKRRLESNEFHERFAVYAGEERHAFYQLDPDTMLDLIALRTELGAPVNIEFLGHKVLVYTTVDTYNKAFRKTLSFVEVLNEEASVTSIERYETALTDILQVFLKIFQTLDINIEKAKSK